MSLNGSPKWMYNAGADFYPYKIDQSLRHNEPDRVSLDKSFASGTDASGTTWSFSAWVKRGDLTRRQMIVMWSNSSNIQEDIRFFEDDKLRWYCHNSNGSAADSDLKTARVFRDNSAWYHILCVKDTTQSTASNRNKIYINGEQVTQFTTADYSSQNYANYAGLNHNVSVGGPSTGGTSNHFDGYIAEVQFINGTALGPEYFGETKEGIWIPKKSYADQGGSYGTNGFYLKYVAGAEGTDSSGNGNNFTPIGLASTDVVPDTPTNNFATLNPLAEDGVNIKTAASLSAGNLVTAAAGFGTGSPWGGGQSTITVPTDKKIYCEMLCSNTTGDLWFGAVSIPELSANSTGTSNTGCISAYNRSVFINGVETDYGSSAGLGGLGVARLASGDILQIAVDGATGKVWFGRNGTYFKSPSTNNSGTTGDPAAGTNEIGTITNTDGKPLFIVVGGNGATVHVNFGADSSFSGQKTSGSANAADSNGNGDFFYNPPTDYLSLCSSNLPNPATVADPLEDEQPSDYFVTTLYTGTNTTNEKNIGFAPDLLWFKHRNGGSDHVIYDSIRGANSGLVPNNANGQNTSANSSQDLMSFDNDGFTVGVGSQFGSVNSPGHTIAAWAWKGGGTASSNSNGSITSSVSANTDAGFSVVSYTGNGGSSATVGHGLTQAPDCIWLKHRTAGEGWVSFWNTPAMGPTKFLTFNSTGAAATSSGEWNNTAPTNTVFTIGNQGRVNTNTHNYIAYCFHNLEGYCKVGQYRGNANANGPFVHCGFRPAWILIRRTASGSDWCIYDSKRLGYNVDNNLLRIAAGSEQTDNDIDLLSNGFKLRRSSTNFNGSGNDHVYIAFAEQPFKYATAR